MEGIHAKQNWTTTTFLIFYFIFYSNNTINSRVMQFDFDYYHIKTIVSTKGQ